MAHVHEHHGGGTTVVDGGDREGPAMALIVLIVMAVLALLIWFIAFSGVVIDRDTGPSGPVTNVEDNRDTTNNFPGTNTEPAPPQGTGG
jgi:hypothetical protein